MIDAPRAYGKLSVTESNFRLLLLLLLLLCLSGGCAPGTGGTACNQCLPGFYSTGGKPNNPRPVCKPCGLHFTSPPGAIGPAYCECEAGYGSGDPRDSMSDNICDVCPVGTYNPGPGLGERHIAALDGYGNGEKRKRLPRASPCRPCNAGNPHGGFTTVDVGARSVNQCVCAPGYGGPQCDPCHAVSTVVEFSQLQADQILHYNYAAAVMAYAYGLETSNVGALPVTCHTQL
jgi:hypothetical protein